MLSESFYRPFGGTGLRISPLALGTDNFCNPTPEEESIAIVEAALGHGINLIDTSNSYAAGGSERCIGKALKANGRRDEVILCTKAYYPTRKRAINDRGGSRRHLIQACEDSLERLQTDYIDVYQTHRVDMDTPLEETLEGLTQLRRQGKILYAGSTTAPAWKITESSLLADFKGLIRMVSEQVPYNLLDRRVENEILPAARAAGRAVLAWSPLAMGILAGRYDNSDPKSFETPRFQRGGIYEERISREAVDAGQRFVRVAESFDLRPAHLALLWVKDQLGVTAPLCGPRTLAQLQDLVPLMPKSLSSEMRVACDEIVPPGSATANFFNSAPWMKQRLTW